MHPQIIQDKPGDCPLCGMRLEARGSNEEDPELKAMTQRFIVGCVFTVPVVLLAMGEYSRWLQFALTLPVVLWAGWPFFVKGVMSVQNRSLNMFSLISLGVGAAFLYSCGALFYPGTFVYFETAAVITVLVLLGQVLELKARAKTSRAMEALLERGAKSARLVQNQEEKEIAISDVKVGDTLRVKPGDKVPVDGIILDGKSSLDESMVTGESMPVEKGENDPVIGGTINQAGSFLMRAEKVGKDTLLARIMEQVEKAQRSRAPIQRLADTVSSYFVPAVIAIAFFTFVVWFYLGYPTVALVNAVAVLIIACPCALGLATPLSITMGMGRGAKEGVIIRDASSLEKLEKIGTLVLDKTGTLTEGKPTIRHILGNFTHTEEAVLSLAASLEAKSEHPLAYAILKAAKQKGVPFKNVENFLSLPGKGVRGEVDGKLVLVGKGNWLEEQGILGVASMRSLSAEFEKQAESVLYVAEDTEAVGFIALSDPVKTTSRAAVQALHRLGLRIIVLSGDNEETTRAVTQEVGIDEYHSSVTPEFKQTFIEGLKGKKGLVAMAGDGVNDAPALAAADVGIAMGTGTDVAMESADVTLVKGDLQAIVRAIILSRDVMRNIRQNLFFAFIYNALGIPIAAGILYPFLGTFLSPMIAAAAMSLSSVSVILNSLRLSSNQNKNPAH